MDKSHNSHAWIKVTTAMHAVTDKIKVPPFNVGKRLVDPIRYAS
jgi:hypothetical protein